MKALLIDIDAQRAAEMQRMLDAVGIALISWDDTVDDLYSTVEQLQPEIIIVDVDSPTRDTLEHVAALRQTTPQPVLMLARRKQSDVGISRLAEEIGVSLYVVDALSTDLVHSLIDVTIAHFKSYAILKREVEALEGNLRERRQIERAKCLLMESYGLTETKAYELLRKNAMQQQKKIVDIAVSLIDYQQNKAS